MFDLIYENANTDKFIVDPITNRQILSPQYMNGIKEFNKLKRLVANCADKTSMVDTELLLSLVN